MSAGMRKISYWLAIALGALSYGAGQAVAASGAGFTLSPAMQQIQIRSDQPRVSYALSITNDSQTDQNFVLSAVDFGSLDESGGVAFLGAPASELEHRYGLASWMILEKNTVFVPTKKSVKVTVTIENRQSLPPGGHYGAVLATAVNDPGTPAGDRVGVKQVVSSLILVTKDGGAQADLKLVSHSGEGSWWSLPGVVTQRFQNTGNVHVVPRGVIELKDPMGRVVKRAAINDGSTVILPESFRQYKTTLQGLKAAVLPGKYTLVSTYRYDGITTTATLTSSFWYAGQLIVWAVAAGALVAAILLGLWLWKRPHRNKRIK